jgi:hypothetical protein
VKASAVRRVLAKSSRSGYLRRCRFEVVGRRRARGMPQSGLALETLYGRLAV